MVKTLLESFHCIIDMGAGRNINIKAYNHEFI